MLFPRIIHLTGLPVLTLCLTGVPRGTKCVKGICAVNSAGVVLEIVSGILMNSAGIRNHSISVFI